MSLIRDENNLSHSVIRINEWYIQLQKSDYSGKPEWLTAIGQGRLSLAIHSNLDRLERDLARPYINKKLPQNLRYKEIASWFDMENELRTYADCQWIECRDEAIISVLEVFAVNILR